ncbi:S24 family peptidase [Sphingomonas montanisoli]|nr:helix-turn-helix transcriptional regulator [Sphingomonas montanisoli]
MSGDEALRGKRLYEALLKLKPADVNEAEWAVRAGVNRGFFTNLKNSHISPRSDTLRKVLRAIGKTEAELYEAAAGRPLKQWASGDVLDIDKASDRPLIVTTSSTDGAVEIRQVDLSYSMGPGATPEDFPEETPVLFDPNFLRSITRAPTHRLYVARGDGDSMFPTLINDDQVLIDTTQNQLSQQDRIWALSYDGALMIKRLRRAGKGRIKIISDNTTVPIDEVDEADLRIFGRVIWVGRRV